MTPTQQIDEQISKQKDWKGEVMKSFRKLVLSCSPDFVEEYKWSTGMWSINGKLIVGFGAFKNHVKFNFFEGAGLADPKKLFNNGLESKTNRSVDIFSDQDIDWDGIKELVSEAVKNGGK